MTQPKKILNDPIYGFITVPTGLLPLIDHPWFQRLRYIKQLGLSHLVYPGALHTRFHHALVAMHLMGEAAEVLRGKGHPITNEEAQGAAIAILWVSVQRLLSPQPLEQLGWGLALSVVSSGFNAALAVVLFRAGRTHRSIALEADGRHLMTDVWTWMG